MRKILFVCLFILAVNSVLIQTVIPEESSMKNIVRISILLVMVLSIIVRKPRVVVSIFFLTLTSISLLFLGRNFDQLSFLFLFLFVQAIVFIENKKIEKYLLVSSLSGLFLVFAFLFFGVTENTILDYRNRMTFGTNGVPFFYNLVYGTFSLLVLYALKYFKRFSKWVILFTSIGATTYFYIMTDARGGYYSFLTFLVLTFIIPLTRRIGFLRVIIGLFPMISLGISFYVASLSESRSANILLSFRPILFNNFYENLSISDVLFSSSVKQFDDVNNIVDNSYIHLLVGGGIVICLAFGYLFFKAVSNLYKNKQYVEVAFLISTCLYFNLESIMVRVENMFIIYFWYLVIKHSLTKIEFNSLVQPVKQPTKRRLLKKYRIVW